MTIVLVIEDDRDLAKQYEMALSLVGIQPEIKRDGGKALERIQRGNLPHVIVLDLHMPNVSGETLFEEIRTRNPGSKVVVITADDVLAEKYRGKAEEVIVKPTTLEEFIQVVLAQREQTAGES